MTKKVPNADNDYLCRLVDENALQEFLELRFGDSDHFEISYHQEGHSNETLFVIWGDRELVLRRPPAGTTAESAHDVLREYHVMDALQSTNVPLPRTVLKCEDQSIIGSKFYMMERLHGDVIREEEPELFKSSTYRQRIGEELIDSLVAIHALDSEAVGLGDLGHPNRYTERQVDRWTQQLEWAMERTSESRGVPTLLEIADWLAENIPTPPAYSLVHGDYKLDNTMFGEWTPPRIVGIFDWEMATRGNPFMDLGWLFAYWPDESDPLATKELTPAFLADPDYPTRKELLDRYERQTGMSFNHYRFYRTFGIFKIASASEMFFRRYLEGNSHDPMYPKMEERVPAYAEWAKRIIEGEEPL